MHARLSADLIISDPQITVLLDGSGNCIEIEEGIVAIGSGGLYAQSAATALHDIQGMSAEQIAIKSMKIAADLCVYTNHNTMIEVIDHDETIKKIEGKDSSSLM